MKPLAVDLCCGLGGWSTGLIAEGWNVVGFDVVRHQYGEHQYPAQLVLQDILTIDGHQFRGKVSLIVASPPCQKYSYMAMPWTRAKQLAIWYRDPAYPERRVELNALFNACVRIAREAECPIVIENVCGAQPWIGRAKWRYGSFYLWGDVPALMPITNSRRTAIKVGGFTLDDYGKPGYKAKAFNGTAEQRLKAVSGICIHGTHWSADCEECGIWRVYPDNGVKVPSESGRRTDVGTGARFTSREGSKNDGGSWFAVAHNTTSGHRQNLDGRKAPAGTQWFNDGPRTPDSLASMGGKSSARKAASAHIAKIPFELARHIARCWHP